MQLNTMVQSVYTYSNDWKIKRTESNYAEDLKKVMVNIQATVEDPSVNGIKGPCIFSCPSNSFTLY